MYLAAEEVFEVQILTPFLIGLLIVFHLGGSIFVGWLATRYLRSSSGWFILSLGFSPLTALIFLWVADVPHAAVLRREKENSVRRRHPHAKDADIIIENEMNCPNCGQAVNPITREGLKSPEREDWRLLCKQCGTEIQASP